MSGFGGSIWGLLSGHTTVTNDVKSNNIYMRFLSS